MAKPGGWDTSGTGSSLADAIRRQAAAQRNRDPEEAVRKAARNRADQARDAAGHPSMNDPLGQLLNQIQNINVGATPYETIKQQAYGSVGAQYDPLIEQLKAEISGTKKRAGKNQDTVKQMYSDEAANIAAQLPEITAQMAAASKEAQGQYDATQEILQQEYSKNAEQQNALYKQLGIQAAAPEASQQAMEDQAYFQQQSQSDETAALQALREMTKSDQAYNQQTSNNTRLAGINASNDIGAQLEEYLQGANAKLGGYEAGKESAISAAIAQLQQQDQERIASQEEKEYNRMMDMFNLQLKMQQMAQKDSQASSPFGSLFKGTNGPAGASNVLGELYGGGDTFSSNAVMGEIDELMANPNVIAGKYDSGQKDMYGKPIMNKVNDAYLRQMLIEQMQGGNTPLSGTQYSSADINNAIMALMAYQGKMR
jgi:hypothetical protein